MCARISWSWAGISDRFFLRSVGLVGERNEEPAPPSPRRSRQENELSERLRDLDRELGVRRASREADAPKAEEASGSRYGLALRLGADFVAGVIVGGAIGWGVDRLFGTSPWGLIVFVLLGFAAGVLTVMRSAGIVNAGPPGPDDKI